MEHCCCWLISKGSERDNLPGSRVRYDQQHFETAQLSVMKLVSLSRLTKIIKKDIWRRYKLAGRDG
jgi:hypothetical protein